MSSENYKRLVEVIIPLNHDRYKTYFVHFFAVHFAIFAGIANEFTKSIIGARSVLVIIGLVLSIIWFFVQIKIVQDIKNVWKIIEDYENGKEFVDSIYISKTPSKNCTPASKLMLAVPVGFLLIYVALGIYWIYINCITIG